MAAKQVKDIDYSEYNEEDVSENMVRVLNC